MRDVILPLRSAMVLPRFGGLSRAPLKSGLMIALLAGLAASIAVALSLQTSRPVTPTVPLEKAPPPPVWLDIVKPVHIYSLEGHALAKLPSSYTARRLSVGDTREDILVFGTWQGDQLSLRLRILRGAGETVPSLDTTLVRHAAAVGFAVGLSKIPTTLPTRFGLFEVADVATAAPIIAGQSSDTRNATRLETAPQCSGFRLVIGQPALTFDGLACAGGHLIPRRALACLIDRLDLASAGEDRALIDFFAATDLRRSTDCEGMRLAPDGVHAAWLDDKPATPTEGRSVSRRRHRH